MRFLVPILIIGLCFRSVKANSGVNLEVLRPLPLWNNDASWDLKRSFDYSHLDLRDQETFLWGNPGDSPEFTFANMTMYTKKGEMIVSMEKFAPLLASVECGEKMVLTFKDQAGFQYAIKTWDWVNEDESHNFIMIANYAGCGADEQRQPYFVYNVDYDEERSIAYLFSKETTWADAAHTFDLDYGKATVMPQKRSRGLEKRFGPTFSYDKDVTMDLAHNWNGNLLDLETPSGIQLKVDCSTCGTHGQLSFSGHIKVDLTSLKEFSISASPRDFSADLGLSVSASGTSNIAFTWSKNIGEVALAGFDIPKVASLGAILDYNAGITVTNWSGKASVEYGVSASLSNSAIFKVDLTDPDNNFEFSGWAPKFSQMPLQVQAQVSADIEIYSQPEISLQLSVLGKGYEAAIQLKVPELDMQVTETHNIKGVCGTAAKEGVDVKGNIGVELSLHIGQIGSTVGWQKSLWEEEKPLFEECLALGAGASSTSTPSSPPPSGATAAPPAGGNGANAQTTTTGSGGTHIYVPKPSTTLSIGSLSATPTLVYNCAYMPLICANVAQYASSNFHASTLPSKQLFFFDGNEARKDARRKEACGCFAHSKCTAASVTNLASQIAGPHTFSPSYSSLLAKGPVPTSSATGPIDPRFWSDGIALTCDEFPAASWVQGGDGASTMCATQQWSIFATWDPNPQSGKWMLLPGSGKRSEQDWQGLSHARLRAILAAEVSGLGSIAVAPFWFTTTTVPSVPSKAWIEVGGAAKAVITKRSGDVDVPEATSAPDWAGPGRRIRNKEALTVDARHAAAVDWGDAVKRAPAPISKAGEKTAPLRKRDREILKPLILDTEPNTDNPIHYPGLGSRAAQPDLDFDEFHDPEVQNPKLSDFPNTPTNPLAKRNPLIPIGDGDGPIGPILPPETTTSSAKAATATSTKHTTPAAKATPSPDESAAAKDSEAEEEKARGDAICGDGSEDPDYGDGGFT